MSNIRTVEVLASSFGERSMKIKALSHHPLSLPLSFTNTYLPHSIAGHNKLSIYIYLSLSSLVSRQCTYLPTLYVCKCELVESAETKES